jgi:hypothetical protein
MKTETERKQEWMHAAAVVLAGLGALVAAGGAWVFYTQQAQMQASSMWPLPGLVLLAWARPRTGRLLQRLLQPRHRRQRLAAPRLDRHRRPGCPGGFGRLLHRPARPALPALFPDCHDPAGRPVPRRLARGPHRSHARRRRLRRRPAPGECGWVAVFNTQE